MRIKSLAILFGYTILILSVVACFDDDDDYEYGSQIGISSFSIKDITTQLIECDDENEVCDTTTFTVTGANYKFSINHLPVVGLIYNTDSLPVNTDVTKVVISMSSYGAGISYTLKDSKGADSLCWYNGTDSLNFTEPIIFTAYAADGIATKDYEVKVNVHKLHPDSLQWTHLKNSNFPGDVIQSKQKAVLFNNRIFVFADNENQTLVTYTNSEDGIQWTTPTEITGASSKIDYSSVLSFHNKLYSVSVDNQLYSSSDGIQWNNENQEITSLLATFSNKIIGIQNEVFIEGVLENTTLNWKTTGEIVPADFPVDNYVYVREALPTDPSAIERIMLMGKMPDTSSPSAITWNLLSNEQNWIPYNTEPINYCPNLNNLALIYYDEELYVFGGEDLSKHLDIKPFEFIYHSNNQGKSWHPFEKKIFFPKEFQEKNQDFSYVVDDKNFIWIMFSGERGGVWKGIINRLRIANS